MSCNRALFILLLLLATTLSAQIRQGIIYNTDTGEPVPFASVRSGDVVVFSDLRGMFSVPTSQYALEVQFPGFKRLTYYPSADSKLQMRLFLNPLQTQYHADLARKKANQIIGQVVNYQSKNDPFQVIPPHEFNAYNKLLVTAPPDSISGRIDSVFYFKIKGKKVFRKLDSSDYRFKKFISNQHLFISEKASRFVYDGSHLKEEVSAVRMGGFKPPVYELTALNLQSFSVYEPTFELAKNKYPGIVSPDFHKDYSYVLVDSLRESERKLYVLQFQSQKRKGLSGLLYIDANTFGVAKALVYSPGVVQIKAEYDYQFLKDRHIWFPLKTTLSVKKGRYDRPISIFGYTLDFEPESSKVYDFSGQFVGEKRDKFASDFIYGQSQTWYEKPSTSKQLIVKHPWVKTEIFPSAINKPDSSWTRFNHYDFDQRDENSYQKLDSISGRAGLQLKLRILRRLIVGYIPLGPVDLRLTDLIAYNNYEGIRVGLGGVTNDKFSHRFRLDGYAAYGFWDTRMKYSFGAATRLGNYSNSWIGFSHTNDLREIASAHFATDKRKIRIYDGRPFNLTTFYAHQSYKAYLETKIIPKTESIWQVTYSNIHPLFEYEFLKNGSALRDYSLALAEMSIQWNPFSEYAQTPVGRIETEKGYPRFAFQYSQAVADILDSDLSFGKFDLRIEYEKRFLDGQRFSALFTGGWAFGDVPITQLYNATPNNPRNGSVLERIRPGAKDAFETMFFNEFFSSRYVAFQLRQVSQRFRITRSIKPAIGAVTRMTFGDVGRPYQHSGFSFNTMEKGYFESGLELHAIYSGLGIGCYYRYGAYQLPNPQDNFSIKVNFSLGLGF